MPRQKRLMPYNTFGEYRRERRNRFPYFGNFGKIEDQNPFWPSIAFSPGPYFGGKYWYALTAFEKAHENELPLFADRDFVYILQRVQDTNLARRVYTLQQKFPHATIPELVTMDWLNRHNIIFRYQVPILGGRRLQGGRVPDFVILDTADAMVWAIQGDYFHTQRYNRGIDVAAMLRVMGQIVDGHKINRYVELWESDILGIPDSVFTAAIAGRGLRS